MIRSKAQLGWLATHKKQIGGQSGFEEWLHSTPNIKNLPERVEKKKPKKKDK